MARFIEDAPGTNEAVEACIARFAGPVASLIRERRRRMRARFPTAIELVYDNYNFFVIGFCAEARASTCVASLASSAKGVVLSFYWGAGLSDPHRLLQGAGKQHRFIRLERPERLDDPRVIALLEEAARRARVPLPARGPGRTVLQSVSAKQRPRRKAPVDEASPLARAQVRRRAGPAARQARGRSRG